MRTSRAFALAVLLGACGGLFPPDPARDGEACEVDEECASETCYGGELCAFSTCNSTSDCDAGFRCDEPKDWLELVTLGTVRGACVPGCSVCPDGERWSCASGENRCSFDGRPFIEPGGPYTGVVGEPIHVVATVDFAPDRALMLAEWIYGGEVVGEGLDTEIVFTSPGAASLTLVVTDDEGTTATATALVELCPGPAPECTD